MSTRAQTLFEIETDKAAMEVDAPASGVLKFVAASEGDVLPVGACIGWIVAEGESFAPSASERGRTPGARRSWPLAALALIPRRGRRRRRSALLPKGVPEDARLSTGHGVRAQDALGARPARRPPPGAWRASADCGSRA